MSKIRVLHILNSGRYSGAENVVITIINYMKKDIDFAYESWDGQIRDVLKENEILFYPVKKTSPKAIKKTIDSFHPDIIHAHDYTAGIAAALSRTDIPIINHLHNNSPWLKKSGLKSLAYKLCARRFKKVLTVSDSIMNEYIYGTELKDKTITVGNPIDLKHIRMLAGINNQLGYSSIKKEYDIAFLGRETPQKNPIRFLHIIKTVKDSLPADNGEINSNKISIKAIMIGDGELREQVRSEIEKLGLTENIDCVGFQSNPYLYLKKAKIMVMPSEWEGFGLAAVEALCLGIPVVASPVGGLTGIINNTCGKLCQSDEDFLNEIVELLANKMYYKMKSNGAIKRSNDFDNINDYMKRMNQIYKEVLGKI